MHNYRSAFQAKYGQAKCFHILGFDILLDSACKPWLLEINANPSLNIDHEVMGKDGRLV
jgi:tubulin polyglutamylase TTLL11